MNRLAKWFATCFGLGNFPVAPGTFASGIAILCGIPLVLLGWKALLVGVCAAAAIGVPACGIHARATLTHDPGDCVVDEVAGQWLALMPLAAAPRGGHWLAYVLGFSAFRLFDIWKPWPVWWAERLPGGAGIVADDLVAGTYAGIIMFGGFYAGLL